MAARGERADVVFLDRPGPGAPRSSWVRWTGWAGADRLHLLQPGDAAAGSPPAGRMGVEGPAAPAGGSLSPYGACGVCGGAGQNPRRWYVRYAASEVKTAWEPGAQRAAPAPFYFVCYASFGGMAVATPLITTSPCWLVHTVSSLTIFFSGNSSWTVQVAVTVSPI